eukprot:752917-Hanusia_phi.AAC.2
MDMRREIRSILDRIKQMREEDPLTLQLQSQLCDMMESFRQTCINQDNAGVLRANMQGPERQRRMGTVGSRDSGKQKNFTPKAPMRSHWRVTSQHHNSLQNPETALADSPPRCHCAHS